MPIIGSVTQMNTFSALLELRLDRVQKDDLPTHPKLYGPWLAEKKAERYVSRDRQTTGFGPMPEKPPGNPVVVDTIFMGSEKSYTLVPHALGFVAEYELIRWDKHGVFVNITKKLNRSGVDRKNVVTHAILNNFFSTADSTYTTWAGEALGSTAHTLLRGGTGKNAPTVATALSYLGLQEAITDYMMLVNEDGLYISLSPKMLVCHPSRAWVAQTLLKSELRPGTADNDTNTLTSKGLDYHTSPYLTDTDAWFLLSSKNELSEFLSFAIGDDLMFREESQASTFNRVYSVYGSWRVMVSSWRGTWGSAGS